MDANHSFVFELFMEENVHPFYATQIINILTQNKLNINHAETVTTVINNPTVITDIPDYLEVEILKGTDSRKVKKIRQYKGFLFDLRSFSDSNGYLLNQLSKRNRKNLFSKLRKLENDHQVTYKMYHGDITKEHYDYLIDIFYKLFDRRFEEKKIYNKNLIHWKYYHELIYPMILEKKASLYVIYDQDKPIDITLNFHLGDIVFSFMHTYDIDYSKYNMGDISMLKHLDWCFGHQIDIFDLSIGETGQKIKWCNYSYDFKYHIFYNHKSLRSKILTQIVYLKLKLKQFLRDKNIIGKLFQYDKFFYKRRAKKLKDFDWRNS